MIIGPRRAALIGTIAAVALAIIFYPLIIETPIDVNKVNFTLTGVTVQTDPTNDQNLIVKTTFNIRNDNDLTLTTSKIDYELFANGTSIGSSSISYEDVPVNGRPALFANSTIPISDSMTVKYSDANASQFKALQNNSTNISWRVQGSADIESGTTLVTKEFTSTLK